MRFSGSNSTDRYAGRHGLVYLSTVGGTGVASSVIGLTNWNIDMATDKIDVTGFGSAIKTYVQGLRDQKGSFAGNWDDTEKKMYGASQSASGCNMYLYPSSDAIGIYFYGPAWVDFSITCDSAGATKTSANWVANGDWAAIGMT